jgi:methylthioribose-1-phosphate isomerase
MADEQSPDASRRQFFRVFSKQTVVGAGSVLGAVNDLRQAGATAANQLLGLTELPEEVASVPVEAAFRSPYRFTGEVLLIVDQRQLPGQGMVIECRTADAAAAAIRAGAAGSGPVLGQIAAFAMVLAATTSRDRPTTARRAALRTAASTLRAARFNQRALRSSIERMEAIDADLHEEVDATAHINALRAEAEAIATEAALDHGRLGQVGAGLVETLVDSLDNPPQVVDLLVHADGGPISGGLVGTTFAVLSALQSDGRRIHVWLTEAAPTMEGARTGAWQLAANDVPHTIVADTAVAWLVRNRRVHAALLRADWACANGDIAAPVGSLAVARFARDADIPVYALAPAAVVDPTCDSGAAIPTELRQPVEGRAGPRVDPSADVVPAELISQLVRA